MQPIIHIQNLVKDFRSDFWKPKVRVIDDLSLTVNQGEIFAFLGPNGAGKTTTIKMVMGLVYPTSGTIQVFGQSTKEVEYKRRIGFLPESPYFYEYLTTEEFLSFYCHLFGIYGAAQRSKIDEMLELVNLSHAKGLPLRKFSKGMLQRIGIAQALVNDPDLAILDEPMSGLDPIGRKEVKDIILRLKDQGKTIFFSSHILHDAEVLCEKVAIITHGKLRDFGSIDELLSPAVKQYEIMAATDDVAGLGEKLQKFGEVRPLSNKLMVTIDESDTVLDGALAAIKEHKAELVSVVPHKETLEDLFISRSRK